MTVLRAHPSCVRFAAAALVAMLAALLTAAPGVALPAQPPAHKPSAAPSTGPSATPKPKQASPPTATPVTDANSDPSHGKISSGKGTDKEEEERTACEKKKSHGLRGLPNGGDLSVECMTEKAVRTIFGMPKHGWVVKPVLSGILKIPDFVETPAKGVGDAEWLAEAIGFALLLGVVTFTMLHYLAAGMTSQGGSGLLLDGVARCVGAGMLILAWPFIYENAGNLTNAVSAALIPDRAVDVSIAAMTAAGTGAGAFFGGWGALIGFIAMVSFFLILFVGLLLVKIGLLAGLLVVFVGMPIALALWPIPSLTAPAAYGFRFAAMVFSVTVMWALCFKVFGAVNTQFITVGKELTGSKKVILPLIGLAELGVLMAVPRHAVAMWNIAPRKGTLGSMATFAASNFVSNQLGRARSSGGGRGGGQGQLGRLGQSGAGQGGGRGGGGGGANAVTAAAGAGAGAQGGAGRGNSGTGRTGTGNTGGAHTGTGRGTTTARRPTLGPDGLPAPLDSSRHAERRTQRARGWIAERWKQGPPSGTEAQAAFRHIAAAEGGRFAQPLRDLLHSDDGARIAERMAVAAGTPGISAGLRESLTVLGATALAPPNETASSSPGPVSGGGPAPTVTPPRSQPPPPTGSEV